MTQTILVTGGAGYLGGQFIRELAMEPAYKDATIRIYDNLMRRRFDGMMDLPAGLHYQFVEGDILDRLNLERAMAGVDKVVHLAGLVSTPFSFKDAEWMQQVNGLGTAAVVDTALEAKVTHLVFASSAAVYGPGGPFRESDKTKPMSPYANSVAKAETELRNGAQRGLATTIVRLGSLFGVAAGMGFEDVISRLSFLAGVRRTLVIHGDGEQIRPMIHVQDAARLLRLCLEQNRVQHTIVNGVTLNPSVKEIVEQLERLVPGLPIRYTDQDMLTRISYQVDGSRALELGFVPQFDLAGGLSEVLFHWRHFKPIPSIVEP